MDLTSSWTSAMRSSKVRLSAPLPLLIEMLTKNNSLDLGYYDARLEANAWLGMHSSQPPTRWQKAVRPAANSSAATIKADTLGPHCSQVSASAGQPVSNSSAGAEDCLLVNVYAPTNATLGGEAAPVIVWIYGGGYGYGYPDAFGNVSNVIGVDGGKSILVTIQYRLDIFGFLAGTEIQEKGFANLGVSSIHFCLDGR